MFNKNNQQTTTTILLYFCKKSWSNFRCKNYPHFFPLPRKYFWLLDLKAQQPPESSPVNPMSSSWSCGKDWKGTRCRFGTRSSRRPHWWWGLSSSSCHVSNVVPIIPSSSSSCPWHVFQWPPSSTHIDSRPESNSLRVAQWSSTPWCFVSSLTKTVPWVIFAAWTCTRKSPIVEQVPLTISPWGFQESRLPATIA